MSIAHNLGFPRIGAQRELKRMVETYWQGELEREALLKQARALRRRHWELQVEAGLQMVPVGDFAWYDHVLNHSMMFGVIPERFGDENENRLDLYFRMARGQAPGGRDAPACEMTKWFDTNYHYIVPEFQPGQRFALNAAPLLEELAEARALGLPARPVILGPLSYLWLGKSRRGERLELLDSATTIYAALLDQLKEAGAEWVQIDEPLLVQDLTPPWQEAYRQSYRALAGHGPQKLLCTYFGGLEDNLELALELPVDGLHLDRVRGRDPLPRVLEGIGARQVLSLGVVDGRNVWCCDFDRALAELEPARAALGERLWVGPSCSLLHVPVDLAGERRLDAELRPWLSFAVQKLAELVTLARLTDGGGAAEQAALETNRATCRARGSSARTCDPAVRERIAAISPDMYQRQSPYAERRRQQRSHLNLPAFPTTTIGSFPQTAEIRATRRRHRSGELGAAEYRERIQAEIRNAIRIQEELGLDVLVHGEAERNDMVEYFGEQLQGFAFTENGWVQSYGSRCVKPPIIYGDVSRPRPMTVEWTRYAQAQTDKPVKGMLTGPVTILCWSFCRDDLERQEVCRQIALALRDEVRDLEQAGTTIIQIDEPALREGLPLRRGQWQGYLDWAVRCFRLTSCPVRDDTQVHTHMCYSEFNDIIHAIADLDADVITIESARSGMELLEVFHDFRYPNEIGPGVYDIHSPRVPATEDIHALLHQAAARIPAERLWVNPDCGLKTRAWPETRAALANMVQAARTLRATGD